ncbi:hypothetical protein DHEL01_v202614 [Diaporthe helianthi]|uniref:Uncharacterized protein n=1 Tax=Diaporthe helianthi TaxID=158607 RepID=A0A2P5I908_DIAHE|nr:hypothetical protein DHEL01_v202614 [Diaporthe helianthi]
MSSCSGRGWDKQQQQGIFVDPDVARSTTSNSTMQPGNGMGNQLSSSGVHRGSRSEPLRPRHSHPAPSTFFPDDSASLQEYQPGSDRETRWNAQMPPAIAQATRYPAYSSASRGSQNQYAPPSFGSTLQGSVSGSSQSQLRTPSSGLHQSSYFFDGATPTGSYSQLSSSQLSGPPPTDYEPLPPIFGPNAPSNVRDTAASSSARSRNQTPSFMAQSINIGVPSDAQMHFYYNQVDNRLQLHIQNNAPQRTPTTPQQQIWEIPTHASPSQPRHVHQTATRGRASRSARSGLSKRVKKNSFNEWTDKRSVSYEDVPNGRPC